MMIGGAPWGPASMAMPVMGYPPPFSAPSNFHPASFQPPTHYWMNNMNNMQIMQPGPIFTSHLMHSFPFQSMAPMPASFDVMGTQFGVARDVSPMRHASSMRHASPMHQASPDKRSTRSSDAEQPTKSRTRPIQAFGVKPIKPDTGASTCVCGVLQEALPLLVCLVISSAPYL